MRRETGLIKEIVRQQVIEMVIPLHHRSIFDPLTHQNQLDQATRLANRRGFKSISTVDLSLLIRPDAAKVSRLKTFLSCKDVRKKAKDSDDKGVGDAADVDFDDMSAIIYLPLSQY